MPAALHPTAANIDNSTPAAAAALAPPAHQHTSTGPLAPCCLIYTHTTVLVTSDTSD